jgi:quinolinate synthase
MQQAVPDKQLIIAPTGGSGASCRSCANCPWMGMNSLENLHACLKQGSNEIAVDADTSAKAYKSLERMMNFKVSN